MAGVIITHSNEGDVIGALSFDHSDGDRQVESPRTCTRWIEKQHALDHFVARPVTVTEDHNVGRFLSEQVVDRRSKDVSQQNSDAADGQANDLVAVGMVIIAADERHRRNLAQRLEDMLTADVAGVKNVVHALKSGKRLGANQPVSVGNDADTRAGPPAARCPLPAIPRRMPSLPSWNPGIGL